MARIGEVVGELSGTGIGVLLVEQDVRLAYAVASRVVVMAKGRIVADGVDQPGARELLGL